MFARYNFEYVEREKCLKYQSDKHCKIREKQSKVSQLGVGKIGLIGNLKNVRIGLRHEIQIIVDLV